MSDILARFEPRSRSGDLSPGLAARVHDPAWILSRQWVFCERIGMDGGTPVIVDLTAHSHQLTTVAPAHGEPIERKPLEAPVDMLVEATSVRGQPRWTARLRIAVGREFVRQMAERGLEDMVPAVAAAYPISRPGPAAIARDQPGSRLLAVAAGRLPDGQKLYASATGAELPGVPSPPGREQDLTAALEAWRSYLSATMVEPLPDSSAWEPERLEHRFALRSPSLGIELGVDGYHGDGLDWSDFDANDGGPVGAEPQTITLNGAVPAPVRFRGMPVPRHFEFEDASVDLGGADAAPSDLALMALLEYAFVYGNDAFSIPLRLKFGTFTTIESLRVRDTFGAEVEVRQYQRDESAPGRSDSFALFALSKPDGSHQSGLLLPHCAGHRMVGPAVEEVRLLRDEMANLTWAIEARIEGGDGAAVARSEEEALSAPPRSPPSADARLAYRLQSGVPPYWLPLVLQPLENHAGQRMLRLETLSPSTAPPLGQILPQIGALLHEEEVPREGIRLQREAVLCRWVDGSTHLWTRRRRTTGRGEGSSGLRFDFTEVVAGTPE